MRREIPIVVKGDRFTVETDSLHKRYGYRTAVDGLRLTVPEGAVYALVGPNGSGKTTTFKILLDLVRADRGSARVQGLDSIRSGPEIRGGIGYVAETHTFGYGWMRVGRLLRHHAAYFPTWDDSYEEQLVRRLEIRRQQQFGSLSKGEARRVQLVLALAHRPPVLLLDEPLDGLDPLARDQVLGLLAEHLAATPTTVLVSTHLIHLVERLVDYLGVLRNGRFTAQARRDTLEKNLRRYRAEIPEGWPGAPSLDDRIFRKNGGQREISWVVWGEEEECVRELTGSGATVRGVERLNLEDSVLALLSAGEEGR